MLETPHVIVAAAIATKIPNPLISLPLAFGSHFLFEKVPHWNPHINTEKKKFGKISNKSMSIIVADSVLALALGIFIASFQLPNIETFSVVLLACFFGVLPDLVEAPYYFLNNTSEFIVKRWIPFKKSIQVDAGPVLGLTTQIIVSIAALWTIFG